MGLFGKKQPKEEVYITKFPDMQTQQAMMKYVNEQILKENAALKAKLIKQEETDSRQAKQLEKEKKKEEQQLKTIIRKQKIKKETEEKKKSVQLIIKGSKLPTFFLKNNQAAGEFLGVQLTETDDGYSLWYPLLKRDKKEIIFLKPAMNFEEFFRENIGIVSQIRGGKVDSNFDIDPDGKPLLIRPNIKKLKNSEEEVEVIHLDDQEKREYEQQIQKLTEIANQYAHKLKEQKKKEIEYESELASNEIAVETANKERDTWAATIALIAQKQPEMMKELANALGSFQDMKLGQILESKLSAGYREKFTEALEEYKKTSPIDIKEIEVKKTQDIIKSALADQRQPLPPPKEPPEEAKPKQTRGRAKPQPMIEEEELT